MPVHFSPIRIGGLSVERIIGVVVILGTGALAEGPVDDTVFYRVGDDPIVIASGALDDGDVVSVGDGSGSVGRSPPGFVVSAVGAGVSPPSPSASASSGVVISKTIKSHARIRFIVFPFSPAGWML